MIATRNFVETVNEYDACTSYTSDPVTLKPGVHIQDEIDKRVRTPLLHPDELPNGLPAKQLPSLSTAMLDLKPGD